MALALGLGWDEVWPKDEVVHMLFVTWQKWGFLRAGVVGLQGKMPVKMFETRLLIQT